MKCSSRDFINISTRLMDDARLLRFKAKGKSMHPAIKDGDILTLEKPIKETLKEGEIIFFLRNGKCPVIHRIKRIEKEQEKILIYTGGDSLNGADEAVDLENVIGRVCAIERNSHPIHVERKPGQFKKTAALFLSRALLRFKKLAAFLLYRIQGLSIYRFIARRLVKIDEDFSIVNISPSDFSIRAKKAVKIIGRVTLSFFPDSEPDFKGWWIFSTWVNWPYRRCGIANRLVNKAVELAALKGTKQVNLLAFSDSKAALDLYQSLGFKKCAVLEIDRQLATEEKISRRKRIVLSKLLAKEE
ncbi:MAG: signal peptidase I [Candidatus Omnitrophota bacterium]